VGKQNKVLTYKVHAAAVLYFFTAKTKQRVKTLIQVITNMS